MKKNHLLIGLCALAWTACDNESIIETNDGRVPLQVTSDIQTRAYNNQWEAGDRIGIYAFTEGTTTVADGYANIPYTTASDGANGSFSPDGTTIYLPTDGTERDFVAYYPYTTGLTDGIYTVDVSDQTSQEGIDLMAAATQTADRTNPDVAFNFTHMLCKVEVTLEPGSGMTATDLEGLTLKLTGQQPQGTFDVKQPTSAVSVTEGTAAELTLLTNAAGTFAEGIILPAVNYDGMSFVITLAGGTSMLSWPLSNATTSSRFDAGKKYLYTLRVNKAGIDVTATITDWMPGNGAEGEQGDAYL